MNLVQILLEEDIETKGDVAKVGGKKFNSSHSNAYSFLVLRKNGEVIIGHQTMHGEVAAEKDKYDYDGQGEIDTIAEGRFWLDVSVNDKEGINILGLWSKAPGFSNQELYDKIEEEFREKFGTSINFNSDSWYLYNDRNNSLVQLDQINKDLSKLTPTDTEMFKRHTDPDVGAGGVDKGTYKKKKQKGKKKDRYVGGGETKKFGYQIGDDPEYSSKIKRFREVIREEVKRILFE